MIQVTMRRLLVALAGGLFVLAVPRAALSSPPANDNFADADVISTLPFTDSGDLSGTTTEAGESTPCIFQPQTIWYTFTPSTTTVISADLNGSQGPMILTAYQSNGGGIGGLGYMSCVFGGSLTFTANAGTTYYFQVGSYYYGSVHAQFNVREIPPPPNDNFADAKAIGGLPFTENVDLTAATTEPGEPVNQIGLPVASVWYVFTASESGSVTANANLCCTGTFLAAYTGDSLADLTEVATSSGMLTFIATAGTTYRIQAGRGSAFGGTVSMSFRLDVTPPPVANLGWNPSDPSTFDSVQFYAYGSYDPVNIGIQTVAWSFGDGTTDTGFSVLHRYPADGDYTAKLTVTTFDGRTASSSQVVHVKTHDVAITRFVTPSSASPGQTRAITVDLRNTRYTETVQIQLLKSVPGQFGGFQLVGTLTHEAPASRNRMIPFDFNYTFTSDDAAIGKVTFQAIATIVNGRDALSADNTAISLPTRVRR